MRIRAAVAAATLVGLGLTAAPAVAEPAPADPAAPVTPAPAPGEPATPPATPPPAPSTAPAPPPTPPPTPGPTPPAAAPGAAPSDPPLPPAPTAPDPAEDPDAAAKLSAEESAAAERVRVLRMALTEVPLARERLAQRQAAAVAARDELAAAMTADDTSAAQYEAALTSRDGARRDLGNLARLAYVSGPSDLTLVASLLDGDGPTDVLRRAELAREVAERSNERWAGTVAAVAAQDLQRAAASDRVGVANSAVAQADVEVAAARDQVGALEQIIRTGGAAATDGIEAVGRSCGPVQIPQCEPSGWGEGNLTRDSVWIMRVVRQQWPAIEVVGGYRPTDPYPDHPSGRAVDVMMPDGGRTPQDVALGDAIAQYFMTNADRYGVRYMIWRQRIWWRDRDPVAPVDQWRMMGDRGDPTSNHEDHVHITVSTGVSGTDMFEVLRGAR